jgi:hypothetical protein
MKVKKDIPDTRDRRWNSYLTWLNILGAERRNDRRRRLFIPLFGPSFMASSCILITCYTCKLPRRRRKCVGNNLFSISIFLALFTDGVERHMKFHHRQQCDVVSLYGNILSRHEHFLKINI